MTSNEATNHSGSEPARPGIPDLRSAMHAIVQDRYGGPEVLELAEVPVPEPGEDQVLIEVRAASVNPYDWHLMRAIPHFVRLSNGFNRPRNRIPGADYAGVVAAVGSGVSDLAVGDEVFGGTGSGTLADFVVVARRNAVHKPANITFEQAAAVPMGGITALQALRDSGRVEAGHTVLINGAAGGVGTFAVQIAKAMGAQVTAVCSTRNVEMVRSIGADNVIDYTEVDFTKTGQRYDVIIDIIGNHSITAVRRVLEPKGRLVGVGQADMGDWIGPIAFLGGLALSSIGRSRKSSAMLAKNTQEDFLVLAQMLEEGSIVPVIDRTYPLAEAPDAIRYLEEGHARGKVIILP
jgi:NADPH:quinone reductase-like Zn-dependent oxidoreductase